MNWEGAFAGVRVLELAQYVFVPGAGAILADLGADVISVEGIDGNPYRDIPLNDGRKTPRGNLAVEQNYRNKKSVALDLKSAEGRELFLKLVETADVMVTSLRPQAITRLKLDLADLRARNPKIIYARANGLGFKGPEANKAGLDGSAFWARGGFATLYTPADAPTLARSRGAMGDHAGSMNIAFGIAAALFKRATTGEPSLVETSLLATAMWILSADIVASLNNEAYTPTKITHDAHHYPLLRAYQTRDGRWIQMMVMDADKHWAAFCRTIGRSELGSDPRFALAPDRARNGDEMVRMIVETIGARDWEDWRPAFEAFDAPWEIAATVMEAARDPQAAANDYVFDSPARDGSSFKLVSGPVAIDGVSRIRTDPAPSTGEHTRQILMDIGLSAAEITALEARRIVVTARSGA